MLKRHEVEVLRKAGHWKTEMARMTAVSWRSVKHIAKEEGVAHVDDKAAPVAFRTPLSPNKIIRSAALTLVTMSTQQHGSRLPREGCTMFI